MGKQSQTITRVYGNTTTSNPYAARLFLKNFLIATIL